MSTKEMLDAIDEQLNGLSQEQLKLVMKFLNEIKQGGESNYNILDELDTVVKEDKNLLDRLSK